MKQKQIYFWLFLFIIGILNGQTVHYRYDQTGNRTARSTTAAVTTRATHSPAILAGHQGCCSDTCNHPSGISPLTLADSLMMKEKYTAKTRDGETVYELTVEAIDLLPPGFQPSVHTEAVFPDENPPAPQPASTPVAASASGNTGKKVGEIPIFSSVQNGSLFYQVPINIYPGRNGFQPDISLTYNSMAGNGVAGYGWSIGGVSSIVPVHSSYYYDGISAKPETLGANAGYALDGINLRRISAGKYQSEQGQIEATILDSSQKYYFSVVFPDGRKAVYGNKNHTTAQPCYPLTEMTDPTGNFIKYNYEQDGNDYYVSEITYGCNNTVIGKVSFGYNSRTDTQESFRAGKKLEQKKLLSNIRVYHKTTLLHTYTLTHVLKSVNLLKTIGCKAGESEFNPLIFNYDAEQNLSGNFTASNATLLTYFNTSLSRKILFQRYKERNSEATEGLIAWPNFPTYDVLRYNARGECEYGSPYPVDQNILVYKEIGPGQYSPVKIQAKANFAGVLAMDCAGIGKDGIFTLHYKYNASASQLTITSHTRISGIPATVTKNLPGYIKEGSYLSPAPRVFLSGDFTGDGKQKLLTVSGYKTPKGEEPGTLSSRATMIDILNNQVLADVNFHRFDANQDYLLTLDFNGDGRTDLCHIQPNRTEIYSWVNNQFLLIASTTALTTSHIRQSERRALIVGDINGDGKMDLMTSPAADMYDIRKKHMGTCNGGCSGKLISTSADGDIETWQNGTRLCYVYAGQTEKIYRPGARTWRMFLSTGTGFDNRSMEFLANEGESEYLLYDVNGDRLPDLIAKSNNRIEAYLNVNGNFSRSAEASRTVDRKTELLPGIGTTSWSAEKRLAHLLVINNATVTILKLNRNDGQRRKIASVVNSLGVTQKVYYKPMSDLAVYKTEGSLASGNHYPLILNESLVSSMETWCNNVKTADHTWQYRNSAYHPQGIGFCGFEKIIVTDKLRSNNTVYTYAFPKHGVVSEIDSPEQNVKFQYQHRTNQYKVLTLNITQKEETNKLTTASTRTTYQYDSYDNPVEEKVVYTGARDIHTTHYTYNYSHSKNELSKVAVTTEQNGTWQEEMNITSVHPVTRQPQTIIRTVNGRRVSETNQTWENGNLKQIREKQYDSPVTHTIDYTVDAFGRIVTVKNPLNLTTTYEYDNENGNLKKVQDHNLNDLSYEYDDFARVVTVRHPDNTIENTLWEWVTSPGGATYKVTHSQTGQPSSVAFFDALHRQVRTGSERFDNTWLYTDYQYDNRGRLIKETLPFKTSPLSAGITYTYDNYDRVTQVNHPSGSTTRRIYDNLKTTTIENGISTMQMIDPTGKVVSVTTAGRTIRYEYTPGGQLRTIYLPNGKMLVTTYDTYGRVQSESDPNSGTITYTYDSSGNLATATDSGNNVTEYTYDNWNRLTSAEKGDVRINYIYQKDLLTNKSNNQGNIMDYKYDTLNRLTKVWENAYDGKWLQREFTYTNGNISSITYTSRSGLNVTVNNQYVRGHHTEQKLNNQTSLYKMTAENSQGVPTAVTTGGVNRMYGYTNYGVMNSRSAKNSSNTFQHFTYGIDAVKGVLNSRKDNTRNKEELFSYDNLNRLTNFANTAVTYDPEGNITSKGNTGNYLYTDNTKTNAVTQLNNVKPSVPVRNQTVEYYSFKRPKSITENGYTATFSYNANFDRTKMHLTKNGAHELTRYYMGGCYEIDEDRVGNVKEKLYLGGDYYSAPAVYVKENDGSWQLYNICRDHLGSITHLTNSSGSAVTQELSYDAWGNLRNPATQINYTPDNEPTLFLGRGYTGHEHLPWFGLVNMNARLYDPALGRFLAPDPYVQLPGFTQSYNRYSYCLNNPLMYVDENGEFVITTGLIIGGAALIGGAINVAVNWKNIDGFWQGFTTFAVGAGAGALTAATGGTLGPWAAAGVAAAGGMVTAANNNIVAQTGHNFSGFNNINWKEVGMNSLAGGASGFAASIGGHYAGNVLGSVLVNGTKAGPVLERAIQRGLGAVGSGYAGGFASGFIMTGSLQKAHAFGVEGAKVGLVTGVAQGAAEGFIHARKHNLNPWTGKHKGFTYTESAGKHGTKRVKYGKNAGQPTRPYMDSPLTVHEIMSTGPGTPDATYKGGMNWKVPGTFRGSQGIWELGINPETGVIYHFNFK